MELITIVKWNKPNVLTVYFNPEKTSMTDVTVNLGAKILPGNNKINKSHWAKIKEKPLIKHYIESGDLEEFDLKKDLTSLMDKQCRSIIKGTFDTVMLNEWKGTEKRASVIQMIDAQLKFISDETRKKKEDDNSEEDE